MSPPAARHGFKRPPIAATLLLLLLAFGSIQNPGVAGEPVYDVVPRVKEVPKGAHEVGDYNGDGIPDFLIENKEASGTHNDAYDLYLSDKKTGTYHVYQAFVSNPSWDPKEKTLTSNGHGGAGFYTNEVYRFPSGKPKLVEKETRIARDIRIGDQEYMQYILTTRILVGKRWKETVQKSRPEPVRS
jgi:hypothetical protein